MKNGGIEEAKKEYLKLRKTHEGEESRLKALELRVAKRREQHKVFEDSLSKFLNERSELLKGIASSDVPESRLTDLSKQIAKGESQLRDSLALLEATEEAIVQSRKNLESLQTDVASAERGVWRSAIPGLRQEVETALGDKLQKLWIAIIEAGLSCRPLYAVDLPIDLSCLATPHPIKDFRDEILKIIIG